MKSFDQHVADWARSKPADEAYDYVDGLNCAMCQFLRDAGMAVEPAVALNTWVDIALPRGERRVHEFSEELHDGLIADAGDGEWTFGALADRLAATLAQGHAA